MMFDNSPPESPSTWDQVKAHVPLLLAVGGGLTLFVSMHTGAFAVATVALLHVALGLGIVVFRNLRSKGSVDR